MMLIIVAIIIIVAIVIAERQMMLQQKMVEEHRAELMKAVETYESSENDIFNWFFSEDDRKEYRRLIELGRYDHRSVEEIIEDMEQTEYTNWCAR